MTCQLHKLAAMAADGMGVEGDAGRAMRLGVIFAAGLTRSHPEYWAALVMGLQDDPKLWEIASREYDRLVELFPVTA